MAEPQRTMAEEYARLLLSGIESCIITPAIEADSYEIKPEIIQMVQQFVQFDGLQDDPNAHIANFLKICDSVKINGATDDAIRLRLFPFSLRNRAEQWFNSLPSRSITTWDQMAEIFLKEYFSPAKMRDAIFFYAQIESETLYDTWERFKDLLRRYPHHELPTLWQVHIFYNGLNYQTRMMINAAARGTFDDKTPEAAQELIEVMAMSSYRLNSTRAKPSKLAAPVEALGKKIDRLSVEQSAQNNPYNDTYNPSWRSQPNFSWGNQGEERQNSPPGFQQHHPPQDNKPSLEDLIIKLIQTVEAYFQAIDTFLSNQEVSIHNLQNQIGKLGKLVSERLLLEDSRMSTPF